MGSVPLFPAVSADHIGLYLTFSVLNIAPLFGIVALDFAKIITFASISEYCRLFLRTLRPQFVL